jgi:hypothetical protein
MTLRLTALSVMLVLMTGCATESPPPRADTARATFGEPAADPELRGALIIKCRVPCNVSPGPGCC